MSAGASLELRRARAWDGHLYRIRISDGVVTDVTLDVTSDRHGSARPTAAEPIDLEGRLVGCGLHDHHIHLRATAAALDSVDLSPAALQAAGGLVPALRSARASVGDGWLRGVGYDVLTSGPLARWQLDAAGVGPVRVQDATGILWILDSAALSIVLDHTEWPRDGLVGSAVPEGLPEGFEIVDGEPTGVLRRCDGWLRGRLARAGEPGAQQRHEDQLVELGRRLAAAGVTSVTDAGASNTDRDLRFLAAAGLPQRLRVMTRDVEVVAPDGVDLGAVKVLLDDDALPPLEDLTATVDAAHGAGRAVAVHCVSPTQVAVALAAGLGPGDRIEHGFWIPDELLDAVVSSGVAIVVSPAFVHERGDRYLQDEDLAASSGVHRLGSLLHAGVQVRAGSDAPYGSFDPWAAMRAATDRRTRSGRLLSAGEAIPPLDAVGLFTAFSGQGRRGHLFPRVGDRADLVVFDTDRADPSKLIAYGAAAIRTVAVGGVPIHGAWPGGSGVAAQLGE